VTLEPPELLNVTEVDLLSPIAILPNPMLDGVADNWPGLKPVPVNGTERVVLDALLMNIIWPLAVPATAGLNFMPTETL